MSKKDKKDKNLKMGLDEIDKKYDHKIDFYGKNMITKINQTNSSRALMLSSQLDQFEVLDNPEIRRYSTGMDDLIGEYSTGYYKTDSNLEIVDVIYKFDLEGVSEDVKMLSYILVVYDKDKDMYDIIQKVNFEKLTENYGFPYRTEEMDKYADLSIGTDIPKGTVLYRSSSYDKYMNYRIGVNAKVLYLIDTDTCEDAMKISESFAKKLTSTKVDVARIPMNDNDIFINLYGNSKNYKSFPDIGENIKKKTIAVQRRVSYASILFDMKSENLLKTNYQTDVPFYSKGKIVDINIYCNKEIEDIDDSTYNHQILKYLRNQNRYYKEIDRKLSYYKSLGKECGDEFNFMLKKSREILSPDTKWRDSNDSIFNNMVIEFSIMKKNKVQRGSKFTGFYGNKGVSSVIVPDENMPIVKETGDVVDIVINGLGDINRLNPSQKIEVETTFMADRMTQRIRQVDDLDEKFNMYLEFLDDLRPQQAEKVEEFINELSHEQKVEFMEELEREGIRIEDSPFWDGITFDDCRRMYRKYDFKPYHLYTHRFGRKVNMLNEHVVGELYIMKLKHTAENKFSARSTAHINLMDLPEKSSATKNNKSLYAKTPVKIVGEMELQNLLISNNVDFVRNIMMTMASSLQARRNVSELYENDPFNYDEITVDEECTNRNIEILMRKFSCMGIKTKFIDDDGNELDL